MSARDEMLRRDWSAVRPVVTRRDRRAHASRALILDAALSCLVEQGYAHASTLSVQRRADVSRGRMLHLFPSKDMLLVAAAQRLAATQVREAGAAAVEFGAADGSPERVDEAVRAMWQQFQAAYFRAAAELWVAASHNDNLRAFLDPAERRLNVAIRDAVAAMFGSVHAAHHAFEPVTNILLTSMRGLAVADAFEGRERRHERHLRDWIGMARALLLAG